MGATGRERLRALSGPLSVGTRRHADGHDFESLMDAQNFDLKLDPRELSRIYGNTKLVLEARPWVGGKDGQCPNRHYYQRRQGHARPRRIAHHEYHGGRRCLSARRIPDPGSRDFFNTIYVCGGPADSGSLRKIELRHSDGTKKMSIFTIILSLAKRRWTSHFSRAM